MNILGKYFKFYVVSMVLMLPAICFAVTQKEMEQARTIAAKSYIRYANDGSGYLDDLNPSTMEELEAALKPKEKENIKAFKAIPVPTDYQNWDKEKLVEYWAVTAFKSKGLLEKGRGGRIRARSQINKMTISNQPAEATPVVETSSATPAENAAPDQATATNETQDIESIPQLPAAQEENLEEDLNVDKASNYTWVYIMVLAILVAIVIALVVYAANVMKKNGNVIPSNNDHKAYQPQSSEKDKEMMERYETQLSDKNVEISMLKKKLESASRQNSDLKQKLETLTLEVESLRAASKAGSGTNKEKQETVAPPKSSLRSIYLGRANSRGIFVRADRTFNPEHSLYLLDTSDGFSGSFRIVDSQEAWTRALSNPREYLATACMCKDLDEPGDATQILTESSGTAVFEGGCWRVIRKARIRYES